MKTTKYLGIAALALGLVTFSACSDDDNGSDKTMTIQKVYLQDADASVKDREVDFARLGQLVRIEGTGFTGLKRIYINGYQTEFNNALMTDNNVWVQFSSNTPIADADASVRNTIRFWKSETNYVDYQFTVRAASPSITSISCTLPQPGETVVVNGTNLQETTSVTLPGGTTITTGIISDEDGEWFSFTMPDGISEGGSIISEGANGQAKSPAYFNEKRGMILDFDGNGTQGGWSATYTSDDDVQDPLNSGRGTCVPLVPASVLAEGGIKNGAHGNGWFTAGNDVDDWTQFYPAVPADTPVEEVALQFDIYCPMPWTGAGYIEFTFQNNLSNYGWGSTETTNTKNITYPTAVCWCPWFDETTNKVTDEPFMTTGWQTITIPLSKVGKYQDEGVYTFADVIADRNGGSYKNFGMFLVNSDIKIDDDNVIETGMFNQMIYVDNWRIVPYKSFTISDFPEE